MKLVVELVPRDPAAGGLASPRLRLRRAPGTGSAVPWVGRPATTEDRPPFVTLSLTPQEGLRRGRHGLPMLRPCQLRDRAVDVCSKPARTPRARGSRAPCPRCPRRSRRRHGRRHRRRRLRFPPHRRVPRYALLAALSDCESSTCAAAAGAGASSFETVPGRVLVAGRQRTGRRDHRAGGGALAELAPRGQPRSVERGDGGRERAGVGRRRRQRERRGPGEGDVGDDPLTGLARGCRVPRGEACDQARARAGGIA